MTHTVTLERFKKLFPQYVEHIDVWFPNGRNCIRIRLKDKREIIFTYDDNRHWLLETVDHYIDRIKAKEDKK